LCVIIVFIIFKMSLLLSHGANPNVLYNGMSPLAIAMTCGNDDAVQILLENKAGTLVAHW
jgi:ankyrin repeat protein